MTDNERYFLINGRRWRRTDPLIPAALGKQLTDELMAARRAVKAAKASDDDRMMRDARTRVHDAKLALGERGHPWWETPTDASLELRLAATIRTLLRNRDDGKTICPSEAARVVGDSNWRSLMPMTREVAWQLEAGGWLIITQRGARIFARASGAIRLRRSDAS